MSSKRIDNILFLSVKQPSFFKADPEVSNYLIGQKKETVESEIKKLKISKKLDFEKKLFQF